ncbi:MAG: nicotinate-nucleotide diphosphorylase (carboxylating) [Candidatus Binatia bacterium]|nr:MAG: nicotinate-nucleotide diphosphorylase (carboxylating) [Candidatus Binatia bacterium]
MNPAERLHLREVVEWALREDWGSGDITSSLTVPAQRQARAFIRAKASGVLAGAEAIAIASEAVGGVRVDAALADGSAFEPGRVIAELSGRAQALLAIERVTLNILQHLSGVASLTRRYVDAVAGTGARIVDTRKTLPGLRLLQKYAVRVGGGHNHRFGLSDGVLIKNNHITAAGGLRAAVEAARRHAPHPLRVEVECRSLEEVEEALAAGAEAILLDNMDLDMLRQAVERIAGRALTEASGGVRLETVRAIAETGVNLISVGALTHSAPAIDLHMVLEL